MLKIPLGVTKGYVDTNARISLFPTNTLALLQIELATCLYIRFNQSVFIYIYIIAHTSYIGISN